LQFTLRTLLLIVSALAATLGAVRWLGAEAFPFILMAVGIWLTARTKARHLLVWLVPALWSMCAFGSWHLRGDEYGQFHACILPCIWLALLPLKFGHLSEVYQLLIAAGALPMAAFGFLLDRLPVSRRLWGATFIVASVALFAWGVLSLLSLEKAFGKDLWSLWILWISSYAFCAASLAMYASVLTCLGGGAVVWLWRRFRRRDEI
jgi:hypothetical protein